MPHIRSMATAVPPNEVSQETARGVAEEIYGGRDVARLLPLFERAGVSTRRLVRPADFFRRPHPFEERNDIYIEEAVGLLRAATERCLEGAAADPGQIDHVIAVTTTGLATPSLEARLAHRMGFRKDVRRTPLFGLGCAAGVAALSLANEYCRARPRHRCLVLSVEISSMVFSPDAEEKTDLVGAALFGDGAVAALVDGDQVHRTQGPRTLFSRTVLFEGSQELMGWRFTGDGMRLVLSREIPELIRTAVRPEVERFLLEIGLLPARIRHHLFHPGGPRILEAYREAFGLSEEAIAVTRDSMRRHGNLSSAASLFVLAEFLEADRARAGDKGLLLALGPGFAAEMLLLGW